MVNWQDVEKARQPRSRPIVVLTYSRVRSARQRTCGLAGPGFAKAASRRQPAFLKILPGFWHGCGLFLFIQIFSNCAYFNGLLVFG